MSSLQYLDLSGSSGYMSVITGVPHQRLIHQVALVI